MATDQYPPLEPGKMYHLFNRGNNSQIVFHSPFEVACFLKKWNEFIAPFVETFAWNILPNHFHVVIRTREYLVEPETGELVEISLKELNRAFKRFFISFAMSLHAANGSNGAVFKRRFQRKEILNDEQLKRVIAFVLFNAKRHLITDDPRGYLNGSFRFIGKRAPTILAQDELYNMFGGLPELERYLNEYQRQNFPMTTANLSAVVPTDHANKAQENRSSRQAVGETIESGAISRRPPKGTVLRHSIPKPSS